jgi:hypothetical protein
MKEYTQAHMKNTWTNLVFCRVATSLQRDQRTFPIMYTCVIYVYVHVYICAPKYACICMNGAVQPQKANCKHTLRHIHAHTNTHKHTRICLEHVLSRKSRVEHFFRLLYDCLQSKPPGLIQDSHLAGPFG